MELVVAERDWEPPRPAFADDQIVALRVAFADVAARDQVKQAGGTWNPARKVWQLRYDRVVALGHAVVQQHAPTVRALAMLAPGR